MMTLLDALLVAAIFGLFLDVVRLWRAHKRLERRMESEISGRREFMEGRK